MKKIQTTRIQKIDSRKLRLAQEAVRRLRGPELERAVGGYHQAPSLDCSGCIFC